MAKEGIKAAWQQSQEPSDKVNELKSSFECSNFKKMVIFKQK